MASTLVSTLVAAVALDHNGNDKDKHTETAVGAGATDDQTQPANNSKRHGLPIHSFNHLSKETENVDEMIRFYTKVMGFRRIKRPPFPFAGAWLFMPPSTSLHIIEKDPSVDLPEGPCAAVKKMGNWQEVAKNPASLKRGTFIYRFVFAFVFSFLFCFLLSALPLRMTLTTVLHHSRSSHGVQDGRLGADH
jgi:hypothetical protein